MKTFRSALRLGLLLVTSGVVAQTTVSVPGNANIWGAGFTSAPNPNGSPSNGGGVLPIEYTLPTGATALTFTGVTGTIRFDYVNAPSVTILADGGTGFGGSTNVSAYNSLSGITHTQATGFLVGVFLTAAQPSGTEPTTLSYSNASAGASAFSPVLQQVFFVGDGLSSTSAIQSFSVPVGATRLFLGFADSWNDVSLTVTGLPGFYHDNDGSLSVTISAVPEPSSWAVLVGVAILGFAAWNRRSRPTG